MRIGAEDSRVSDIWDSRKMMSSEKHRQWSLVCSHPPTLTQFHTNFTVFAYLFLIKWKKQFFFFRIELHHILKYKAASEFC